MPSDDDTLTTTREAWRSLACFVVSPARKAVTGRIGLRPVAGGFATPPFPDGTSVSVVGTRVAARDGRPAAITTVRAAADHVGVALQEDPGVGHDLPPFAPDQPLTIDDDAAARLAAWWSLGDEVLARLGAALPAGAVSEAQLWPEHFDLAVVVEVSPQRRANVGFSPGDAWSPRPYAYVGPHDLGGLSGPFWDAPFGAARTDDVVPTAAAALAFVSEGLERLRG